MNAMVALLALLSVGEVTELQGTWKGTGTSDRYTAVFDGEELIIRVGTHPALGARKSKFTVDAQAGTIDIDRSEGKQLGLYELQDGKLTMMLANVNLPRPKSLKFENQKQVGTVVKGSRRPPTRGLYTFEREKPADN